jgi:hypothetical protein
VEFVHFKVSCVRRKVLAEQLGEGRSKTRAVEVFIGLPCQTSKILIRPSSLMAAVWTIKPSGRSS